MWALRGDGFAALGAYLKVLRIREQLVNADSDNSEWRQHLEIILERISRVFVRGTNPGYTDAGREDRQSEAVPPPGIMPNAAHDLNKLAANLGLSFEESAEKLTAAGRGLICGGAD